MNATPALEGALDELYGADPSEFVAVRKRLAAALSASGDKDSAKELRAARRPSTSAWALNQLARVRPDVVEALLERSAELVAAQTRAISGRPDAIRDAIRAHRDALTAATDGALESLGSRANEAFRAEIVSTLRAASTDEAVGGRLRSGRIVREETSSGFPDAVGLTLVPAAATATREKTKENEKERDARARALAAEAREREAQAESERAARAVALRDAARADRDAERARARVEKLRDQLDAAQEELEAALTRSRDAKRAAGTTD